MLPRVLSIAGSDSSGGAGIQADIKSVMAMGGYAMTAITAVTVQNTLEVAAIEPLPLSIIEAQISLVLEDIGADSIKTGMLLTADIIEAVTQIAKAHPEIRRVIDPVMIASSGAALITPEAIEAYQRSLIPIADLVTPNLPEAETLVGFKVRDIKAMHKAAEQLRGMGAKNVLIKGGHLTGGHVVDLLYTADGAVHTFEHDYISTNHTHGTGCSLASAIACLWVKMPLEQAVKRATDFIYYAIVTAPQLGKGHGPINHLYPKLPIL